MYANMHIQNIHKCTIYTYTHIFTDTRAHSVVMDIRLGWADVPSFELHLILQVIIKLCAHADSLRAHARTETDSLRARALRRIVCMHAHGDRQKTTSVNDNILLAVSAAARLQTPPHTYPHKYPSVLSGTPLHETSKIPFCLASFFATTYCWNPYFYIKFQRTINILLWTEWLQNIPKCNVIH